MDLRGFFADALDHHSHVLHLFIAGQDAALYLLGDKAGLLGSLGDLVYAVRDCANMSCQSIYLGCLLRRALGQGHSASGNLFRSCGHIPGRCL